MHPWFQNRCKVEGSVIPCAAAARTESLTVPRKRGEVRARAEAAVARKAAEQCAGRRDPGQQSGFSISPYPEGQFEFSDSWSGHAGISVPLLCLVQYRGIARRGRSLHLWTLQMGVSPGHRARGIQSLQPQSHSNDTQGSPF